VHLKHKANALQVGVRSVGDKASATPVSGNGTMKTYLNMATLLAGLVAAGAALADDDECHVPMSQWQPRKAVQAMVAAKGWTARRIKTDDGCYKIKGRNAEGREIEVKVDPATLAVVEFEYED
jgi:hypothetical protein